MIETPKKKLIYKNKESLYKESKPHLQTFVSFLLNYREEVYYQAKTTLTVIIKNF